MAGAQHRRLVPTPRTLKLHDGNDVAVMLPPPRSSCSGGHKPRSLKKQQLCSASPMSRHGSWLLLAAQAWVAQPNVPQQTARRQLCEGQHKRRCRGPGESWQWAAVRLPPRLESSCPNQPSPTCEAPSSRIPHTPLQREFWRGCSSARCLCTAVNLPVHNWAPDMGSMVLTAWEKKTHWKDKSLAVGCKWERADMVETKGRKERD